MRFRRATASTAVLVASLASLTGCASDGDPSPGTSTPATSSSSASSSSSDSSPDDNAGDPLDQEGVVRALTVGQVEGGTAHVVMTLTGVTDLRAEGDVDYSQPTPNTAISMTSQQLGMGKLEVRIIGGILYLHVPRAVPAGKFVRIDPSDPNDPVAKSFGGATTQLNPLSTLRAMETAVRSTTYVGEATVDGTSTDHYRVEVDGEKLMAANKQKLRVPLPKTMTYHVWLDDEELVRQLRVSTAKVTTLVKLSDWGEPVDVEAPPASALVPASSIR